MPRIALVLKGYPRLSETFIAQEILELERAGLDLDIVSLRHPTDRHTHPVHDEIQARVTYLPEYLYQQPVRVLLALFACLPKPGFWQALPVFLKDFSRDFTTNRGRRFGQALVLAREDADRYQMYYAHFLHTPCSVARYAAIINRKPFAVSAHAKDIWTSPAWEISEKLDEAAWCVTCTKGGADYLESQASDDAQVRLVYHGLDLTRFPPPGARPDKRDGRSARTRLQLLTVGRAVQKKGIDSLLQALSRLPGKLHWEWSHIGGGPLKGELVDLAEKLEIGDRCKFLGALPQEEVLKAYRESDMFVLPSRIDDTGDRDGLPNVIVEAQSQRLSVISTSISGIPELIEHGKNGFLVEPDDVDALVSAIMELGASPDLRKKQGKAGEERVRKHFSHTQSIGTIVSLLRHTLHKAAS